MRGVFERDEGGRLISDSRGMAFRVWRPALDPELNGGRAAWPGIRSPDDIWEAIAAAGEIPGTTAAPKLQPIAARLVMLQTGMRAPMGVKIKGPDLATIEGVGLELERLLKEVPGVKAMKLTEFFFRFLTCFGSRVSREGRTQSSRSSTLILVMFWRAISAFEQI